VPIVNAPGGFACVLPDLPDGARIAAGEAADAGLAMGFVRSRAELASRIPGIIRAASCRPVWIAWPQKSGPFATNLTQQDVRRAGLEGGLVDYKVCSISEAWSGLLFRWRAP